MDPAAPASPFLTYLTCDLPSGYPCEPVLTTDFIAIMKEKHRKELVREQAAFLETARAFAPTHPWIAYLGALKHEALLTFVPIETTPFVNVPDQKEFSDCHLGWRQLRNENRRAIEDHIAFFCERLVLLQREALKINDLERALKGAMTAGFTALLPLALAPPEVKGFGKTRQKLEEELKAWHHQDSYLQLSLKTLSKMSSVTFETRTHGLENLPGLMETLKGLRDERDTLIATYITPFVVAG